MPTLADDLMSRNKGLAAHLGSQRVKDVYFVWANAKLQGGPEADRLEKELEQVIEAHSLSAGVKDLIDRCQENQLAVCTYVEDFYPTGLRNIHAPPPVLFVKGNLENLHKLHRVLAIVGSRKADKFGCELASEIAAKAAASGICIVSGLAYGVDQAAHQGALQAGGELPTIAVLGHGLDTLYPQRHSALARNIIERGGLLISQFSPGVPPFPSNFLNRNRIISGLSEAVLVIQAPERSGSLATARFALEQGREVLVVPGAVNDPRYAGSLNLLKNGAGLIASVGDIFDYFPVPAVTLTTPPSTQVELSRQAHRIIHLLKSDGPLHLEIMQQKIGPGADFSEALLELELQDLISQEPGNLIRLLKTGPI